MIQRIFCPTDLSAHSRLSLAYAFRIARENRAQLVVFHATSFPTWTQIPCELEPYYECEKLLSRFKLDQLLADAECKVNHFVAATLENESSGVAWIARVALGRVAEEIVLAATREEADLIVLGRRKRGALARVFTRSISEAVSKNSPCPVLSIDARRPTWSLRAWRMPVLREVAQGS